MKLYQYDNISNLNNTLKNFNRNKVPVMKVEVLAVDNKVQYFLLTDPAEDYLIRPKVESKTEDVAKKEMKEKKETEPKMPNPKNITKKPEVDLSNEIRKGGKEEVSVKS